MYVITFYSFKGGVGRTMALVNVAAELARRGRKVLVVDFDLEAPGLETYQRLQPPKPHPGIVEYVTEYRRTNAVPNLLDYIYETKPIGKKGGRLWVMPAGRRDAAYRSALAKLDWQRLYKDEQGFLLFEDTKLGWQEELKPDYVLIDSRTGDTDVLGICTRQLPDSVVLMFTPNEQNLAGLKHVLDDIRREKTEGLKKRIGLHFVAANVPDLDDENGILARQLKRFGERLRFTNLAATITRSESLGLLDQEISVLDRRRSKLARTYRGVMQRLIKRNLADRDGALLYLDAYARQVIWRPKSDIRTAVSRKLREPEERGVFYLHSDPSINDEAVDLADFDAEAIANRKNPLNEIAENFLNDADVLAKIAECRILEGECGRAARILDRVLRLAPDDANALYSRALCKFSMAEAQSAVEDLLSYVRLSEQADRRMIHALSRLAEAAPVRLIEAVETLFAHGLNDLEKARVIEVLTSTDEGIARAAELIRALIAKATEVKPGHHPGRFLMVTTLLRARCWREALQELKNREGYPDELFQTALALWGEWGEMPKALCERALAINESARNEPWELALEPESWLLWSVGKTEEALAILDKLQRNVTEQIDLFSVWRQRTVSAHQYLEDLGHVRRMFNGEALRPAFLGPIPSQRQTTMRQIQLD